MIRENELRIGNWLYDNHRRTNAKVESLTSHYINVDFRPFDYDSAKPIPLTEEILLKCGFDKYAESSVSTGWKIGVNPVTNDYLITLVWIKDLDGLDKYPFFLNGHFEIKHLHQLQNLYFALTNKELEIKL